MKAKIIIWVLICSILLLGIVCFHRPNIHTATIEEIQSIYGIGDILSQDILEYLNSDKTATIDDLADINGIGCILIERIKKKWSD